jgi:transposase
MDNYWAKPALDRHQSAMFSPTLDEMISEDHPVRFFDEVLRGLKWGQWEQKYHGRLGQPAIHPQVIAGAILYGLKRGVRSSRGLEDACRNRVDFMWLVEGRVIDHSTFNGFRTRFKDALKDIFRQMGRVAMDMGLVTLVEIAIDGTRIRANNGRSKTGKAASLERRLAELDEQMDRALSELDKADRDEDDLFGARESTHQLPATLSKLNDRRERLSKALASVNAADAARKKKGDKRAKAGAQAPVTDPDSKVLPNKEGGYAPNYTPMATTDGQAGFIVDADVINDSSEAAVLVPAVDRIEATFGKRPEQVMADGAYGTGQNLQAMEQGQVQLITPVEPTDPQEGNPAKRDDPRQPVPEAQRSQLPTSPQTKKLHRSSFVYDEAADCYCCPMGQELHYDKTKLKSRLGGEVKVRVYRCASCAGCPLAARCMVDGAQGRTIERDEFEPCRQRAALCMTQEVKEKYKKRAWIAETPFAHIKAAMGVRQFLLRGAEKVKTEWHWTCTAFNLAKLASALRQTRAATEIVPG